MSTVDVVGETNALGGALTFQTNPGGSGGATLTLATQSSGFSSPNSPDPWTGAIDAAGNCTNINGLGRYLQGSAQGFNREVTFTANFTTTGSAAINLRTSSGWGNNSLEIYLDGNLQSTYGIANNAAGTYTLSNISAGNHSIKFRSAGQDWLEVSSYAFTNTGSGAATGNCLGYGYVGTQKAYGFVYDKSYGEWATTAANTTGASLRFTMTTGNYNVEFWNPQTGATTSGGLVATNNAGVLIVNLPSFNKDIAFKVSYASPIPVELLSFSGNTEGDKNRLNWQTANESNVRDFTIERSEDGISAWQMVGSLSSKGNSTTKQSYFLHDLAPLSKSYYRLITNDLDGKNTFSKVILIERNGGTKVQLKLYPTLAQDNLTVEIDNPKSVRSFQIVDIAGRVWLTENVQITEGGVLRHFSVGQLPNGVYFLVVKTQNGVVNEKFIKQ